jgi:DNA-binding GntR family transcriptional regulator
MITRSLEKTAYDGILGMLMDGRIPRGHLVSEAALAKEMGISRTPVRHAIRQLEAQGLVEQIPKVGTVARIPDRREIAELLDTREAIEAHIAAAAAESISPAHLDELQRLCDRLLAMGKDFRAQGLKKVEGKARLLWYEADLGFHRVLLDAVGNRRLSKVYADLRLLTSTSDHRYLEALLTPVQAVARAYREHSRILRAIRRRNPDEARRLMIAHIRRFKATVLDQMMRHELSGAPAQSMWGRETDVIELLSQIEGSRPRE